jgi:surface polysaccharide O-acyltransferase-like enzyme
MLLFEVNMVGVFLAATATILIAAIWYSPLMFGNVWMVAMGLTPKTLKEKQKDVGKLYGLAFVASLIAALVLGVIIKTLHISTLEKAAAVGFLMWLGFCTTSQYSTWLFSSKPSSLYLINTAYQLTAFIAMGLVLGFTQ